MMFICLHCLKLIQINKFKNCYQYQVLTQETKVETSHLQLFKDSRQVINQQSFKGRNLNKAS